MHPAPSIIFFTTSSGAGYGLLFLLGIGLVSGLLPEGRWFGAVGIVLALALAAAGLVGSTFHLRHPERAWRAVTQWRSSWLSREGVAAVLTFVPALVLLAGWIAFAPEERPLWLILAGVLSAIGAALTVWCTGMIYGCLKPVGAWHQPLTPWLYLAFALMGGALLGHLLVLMFGRPGTWIGVLALVATAAAFALEALWWRHAARAEPASTSGTAIGLERSELVRLVEPPHTQTNYLLTEMGYRVARKHATRLRLIAFGVGLGATLLLTLIALAVGGVPAVLPALLAVATGLTGTALERWLFFAEAKHTVMLYYDRRAA